MVLVTGMSFSQLRQDWKAALEPGQASARMCLKSCGQTQNGDHARLVVLLPAPTTTSCWRPYFTGQGLGSSAGLVEAERHTSRR